MKHLVLGVIFASVLLSPTSHACTAFSATGAEVVDGGGTLVSKIRDYRLSTQSFKRIKPDNGYEYVGLFGGKVFNMGVNSQKLVVFKTMASTVDQNKAKAVKRFKSEEGLRTLEYLLRHCATVDEALAQPQVLSEPTNIVLADPHKIAVIEVGLDGKYAIHVKKKGTLAHTNHFLSPELTADNARVSKSSTKRLSRIQELLSTTEKPFKFEDFVRFTEDRNDGPNNSLFRTGKGASDPHRTISAMVVYLPEHGDPRMALRWQKDKDTPQWVSFDKVIRFESSK